MISSACHCFYACFPPSLHHPAALWNAPPVGSATGGVSAKRIGKILERLLHSAKHFPLRNLREISMKKLQPEAEVSGFTFISAQTRRLPSPAETHSYPEVLHQFYDRYPDLQILISLPLPGSTIQWVHISARRQFPAHSDRFVQDSHLLPCRQRRNADIFLCIMFSL